MINKEHKNLQYLKFSAYGFLRNLRFFDAFFILYLVQQGLTYTQIGILYAIREIVINLFEIPSGMVADTFGRRRTLMISFLSYILSFLIFYFSGHFLLYLLAFTLFGAGDAFRSGTHKGLIMAYLKQKGWSDQKISYYGHTRSWSQRGAALSSLIAGVIVFSGGNFRFIFLLSTIPYVVNLFLVLSYPSELDDMVSSKHRNTLKDTFSAFILAVKNVEIFKLISHSALHSAYLKALKDYIQPLMLQVAVLFPLISGIERDKQNGLLIGIFYFAIYLLTSMASKYASHIEQRNKRLVMLTLFLGFSAGIVSGLFSGFGYNILALLSFVLIYIIENIRKPVLTGYVADRAPDEVISSVLSAQSQIKTILTAGIALIFGLFADHLGLSWALCITSSILVVGVLILSMIKGKKK
jgi:MFS family permease